MIDLMDNIMNKKEKIVTDYLLDEIDNINKKYKDTIDNINEQNDDYLKKK